ncbi:MAG: S9 family peptidase [Acidobacteria bacterium]|nr:S9 family peptidase [Acidobacteriota bacterium]
MGKNYNNSLTTAGRRVLLWASLLLIGGVVFAFSSAFSQTVGKDTGLLSIERIYASREFSAKYFRARWLEDGNGYVVLEPSKEIKGGRDIVRYDAKTGKREVLVSASKLIPTGGSKPLRIDDFAFSPDFKYLLIYTNSKRVWRRNTRGDYYVLDLKNWELKKLGGDAKPSTLMFAKFSPDSKKVAYVREHNIYVEDLEDHRIIQLTKDGSDTIINGTFDWVYEEEFSLRDGFRWSPDSRFIAYWQLDSSKVKIFYLINYTDSLYPKLIPIRYPKAGTTNSACRVGVISASGGKTVWMKVPGDPRNQYIAQMDWAKSPKEIIFQVLNRKQNTDRVMIGDALTGEVRTILTERDNAWVEVVDRIYWLDKGKRFIWVSERDGWRHLYVVSRDGRDVSCITPGPYDVISIANVDEKDGWVYFIASPDDPLRRYLYRVRLDGKGKLQRITPMSQSGTHSYQISRNSRWAFHTFSKKFIPPTVDLIELPSHKVVRTLVRNDKLKKKVEALKHRPIEFFRVDIGNGVVLDGYQIKPYNFDPGKKYPVLFYVYGEPAGQIVRDAWGGRTDLWHLMIAQRGYIVMALDNRGTPCPRGREWRKCIYGKIGVLNSADQAAAVRKIIRRWSYVDPERIGVWGWSGGGSMTLNLLFRYPDLYKTGMAVAPVPDIRLYDTIYQERYTGLPSENKEAYIKGSPITFAHQLKGNLLVVHGTGDDNVHFQGTAKLINELIKNNKQFSVMIYPNRSHGIFEGKNTTVHLRTLLLRYLLKHLPPGPR